tara:strand:+ start:6694 stop:17301 length:10608 start_codon:yes stop_codon:yes gene_type:complete
MEKKQIDVDALKKLHEYYKIEEPFSVWYEKIKKDTPDNREYKKKIHGDIISNPNILPDYEVDESRVNFEIKGFGAENINKNPDGIENYNVDLSTGAGYITYQGPLSDDKPIVVDPTMPQHVDFINTIRTRDEFNKLDYYAKSDEPGNFKFHQPMLDEIKVTDYTPISDFHPTVDELDLFKQPKFFLLPGSRHNVTRRAKVMVNNLNEAYSTDHIKFSVDGQSIVVHPTNTLKDKIEPIYLNPKDLDYYTRDNKSILDSPDLFMKRIQDYVDVNRNMRKQIQEGGVDFDVNNMVSKYQKSEFYKNQQMTNDFAIDDSETINERKARENKLRQACQNGDEEACKQLNDMKTDIQDNDNFVLNAGDKFQINGNQVLDLHEDYENSYNETKELVWAPYLEENGFVPGTEKYDNELLKLENKFNEQHWLNNGKDYIRLTNLPIQEELKMVSEMKLEAIQELKTPRGRNFLANLFPELYGQTEIYGIDKPIDVSSWLDNEYQLLDGMSWQDLERLIGRSIVYGDATIGRMWSDDDKEQWLLNKKNELLSKKVNTLKHESYKNEDESINLKNRYKDIQDKKSVLETDINEYQFKRDGEWKEVINQVENIIIPEKTSKEEELNKLSDNVEFLNGRFEFMKENNIQPSNVFVMDYNNKIEKYKDNHKNYLDFLEKNKPIFNKYNEIAKEGNSLSKRSDVLEIEGNKWNNDKDVFEKNGEAIQSQYANAFKDLNFNVAEGVFKNNFQSTDQYFKMLQDHKLNNGLVDPRFYLDIAQGLSQTYLKAVSGLEHFVANTLYEGTGLRKLIKPDHDIFYGQWDFFGDLLNTVSNYNLAGTAPLDVYRTDKNLGFFDGVVDIFKQDGGGAALGAQMFPFSASIIQAAIKNPTRATGLYQTVWRTFGRRKNIKNKALMRDLRMVDRAFQITYSDYLVDGKDLGLSDMKANIFAGVLSTVTGFSQLILKDPRLIGLGGITPKSGSSSLIRSFANNLKTASTLEGVKSATLGFGKNTLMQYGEEQVEMIGHEIVNTAFGIRHMSELTDIQTQKQVLAGVTMLSGFFSPAQFVNDYKRGRNGVFNELKVHKDSVLFELNEDIKAYKIKFDEAVKNNNKNGEITYGTILDQLNKNKQYIINYETAINLFPKDVKLDYDVLEKIIYKQDLINQKQNSDSSFHEEIDRKIEKVDEEIKNTKANQKVVEKKNRVKIAVNRQITKFKNITKKNTTVSELSSSEIETKLNEDFLENEAYFNAELREINKELNNPNITKRQKKRLNKAADNIRKAIDDNINRSKAGSQEFAIFSVNENGDFDIYLNKDKAMVGSEAHEIGHLILNKTLKNNTVLQDSLGNALLNHLGKLEGSEFNAVKKRLGNYGTWIELKDGSFDFIKDKNFGEEVMTIMSESIIDGSLKYNENLFNKINNGVRRYFQKNFPNTRLGQIRFDDGKDVFNFVKDFADSINKDYINPAIMDVATKGAEGRLLDVTKPKEKIDVKGVKYSKEAADTPVSFNDKFTTREGYIINKFAFNEDGSWMTKEQWDKVGVNKALEELYKEDSIFGRKRRLYEGRVKWEGIVVPSARAGFEIDEINPNVFGVSMDQFVEEVKFGSGVNTGIKGILERFNPENPAQLATKDLSAWINSQINFRKGEVATKYKNRVEKGGISIDKQIRTETGQTIASQIMAEKDVDIIKFEEQDLTKREIELAPKKFIDTINVKNTVKNNIKETVGKANINLKDLTYKGVKKLLTGKNAPLKNVLSDISSLFGIPIEKIIKNADLNSEQRRKAQNYIEKNSQELINMLPEGMTVSGKATGVAPTLLEPFYTKAKRVSMAKTGSKQGLPAQIKNKNIDVATFRNVFGIKGIDKNINNKSVDGPIRALVTQAAMITANQSIRENAINHDTNPFNVIALVGDGKSELMFSKDSIFDNSLNPFTNEQARNLINTYGTSKYNKLADTMDPVFVNLVEQIALNQNRNLGQGKRYQVGVSNLKSIPEVIKNFITKGGIWRGPKLFDNAGNGYGYVNNNQKTYVKEVTNIGVNFHPDILPKNIAFIFGIKDSGSKVYNGKLSYSSRSINPKAHPEAITELNRDREQNRAKEEKYCKDNNIEFEYFKYATPMVFKGRIKKIITDIKSQKGLINKIKKLKEYKEEIQNINRGNRAVLKYTTLKINEAYQNNKISDINVFHFGKFQTNIVEGIRSLSSLDWLYLTKEKQTNNKGQLIDEYNEHVGASSTTNTEIVSYIFSNGKDISIDMVGIDHKSFFGPKTLMNNYLDAKIKDPKTDKMIDNKVSLEGPFRLTKFAGVDRRNIFHITADVDANGNTQNDAADWISKNESIVDVVNNIILPKYDMNNIVAKNMLQFSKDFTSDPKGISVLDFDDTLATTKSKVLYTTPDGVKGDLNAEEYAKNYTTLAKQGYKFDFSEFNKVVGAKIAPLFNKALKLASKFGTDNMFVLTARPAGAQRGIHEFLKSQGLNIPLKNITGLGNSTAEAKALWIADKVSEGYNDFYFADDALANVEAVSNILEQFDVKRKIQQAKLKFSKEGGTQMDNILNEGAEDLDLDFNIILEQTKGVEAEKEFSAAKARIRGSKKNKFKFFIPPSAEDFAGLCYSFFGKGKKGEIHHKFFKDNLFDPYSRGIRALNLTKQTVASELTSLKKAFPDVRRILKRTIPKSDYSYEQAARVYLWNKNGYDIPGLTKTDKNKLINVVKNNRNLNTFANGVDAIISERVGYPEPDIAWVAGSISYDINEATQGARIEFLSQWLENKNIIFSEKNLNKIESIYGSDYRDSLEDILWRMENGTNRRTGQNAMVNSFMDWINGSIGATMFINMRSAVLQTLSTVNFINWHDNNLMKASAAFANQKQFWTDFSMIFNSNWLKQRRSGLQHDVNANEMMQAIAKAKSPVRAAIGYILQKGFKPTQIMDSFAISMGGSSMYRNRIKTYLKQGMNQKKAEDQAFIDLQEIAEETQQSARPDRISGQQASVLGKLILAFQNTPMQYMRLTKKAALDLINGRGDWKTNLSKIIYYSVVQNIIFYSMQSALFALAFDDDEDEEKREDKLHKKKIYTINGMLDSVLRGSGIAGAVVSTLKNMVIKYTQEEKKRSPDHAYTLIEMLNLSPPIGIKARKLYGGLQTWEFNKDVMKYMSKGDIDNPFYSGLFSITEAITNVPLSRAYNKMKNVREALDGDNKTWQRVALFLGWNRWNLGIQDDKIISIKQEMSEMKKIRKREEKLQEKYPGKTKEEIEVLEKKAEIKRYNRDEQEKTLLDLGLNKEEISDLNNEEDRVEKIIEFHNKNSFEVDSILTTNKGYEAPVDKEKEKIKELYNYSKDEQTKTLSDLGLSDKEISKLKKEEDRVNKILELYNEDPEKVDETLSSNEGYTKPKEDKKKKKKITSTEDKVYKLKKSQQVKTLSDLGLEDDEIKKLKYEKDRVEKILELRKENRNKVDSVLSVNKDYEVEVKEKEEKEDIEIVQKRFLQDQEDERNEGKSESRITCAAVKSDGITRCGKKIKTRGSSYCTIHEKVEKVEGGEKKRCKYIKPDITRCKIQTNNKSGLCYYHD